MPGRPKADSAASRRGHASTASQAAPLALPKKIQAAAAVGKAGVVQTWLTGDGRVDATCVYRGVSGCTLLLIAAGYGHKQLVEVLLKRGAKPDSQNSKGVTALKAAAANGHVQVVETLLMHGAEVNLSGGCTALLCAALNGHERVVEQLLRHGAEINLQASDGHTALTAAAVNGHSAVVLQLLRAGADMALRTADGKTALQIAKEKGHTECVAAAKTFLGEVAAERRDAAAVEGGGAGAGSASGGEGGSSGPVPEEIGEAGAGADGDAASGKGAAAAPTAASFSGGVESGTGEDAVPEEIAEAAEEGNGAALLAWLDGGGRVDATFTRDGLSGITLLMGAAAYGHERLAVALLQRGASVDLQNSDGAPR